MTKTKAKTKAKRRPLTTEEKQVAERLKRIWLKKRTPLGLTQQKAALMAGWSSQSAAGQYLNAIIPLNTDAKIFFADLLQVPVTDFDPAFVYPPDADTTKVPKTLEIKYAVAGMSGDAMLEMVKKGAPKLSKDARKELAKLLVDSL